MSLHETNAPADCSSSDVSECVPVRRSTHISRKTSWGTLIRPPSCRRASVSEDGASFYEVDLHAQTNGLNKSITTTPSASSANLEENVAAIGLSLGIEDSQRDIPKRNRFTLDSPPPHEPSMPFSKWVTSLRKRGTLRRKTINVENFGILEPTQRKPTHKKSWSDSSMGFVRGVKSATISLASFGGTGAPRSRRTEVSSRHQRERSSRGSNPFNEDSSFIARSNVIDQDVANRRHQRRRILEEIISTEEGYVADVKFLMNVYVTFMSTMMPSLSTKLRSSINGNLNEIVELHEELLGELHATVPHSEYTSLEAAIASRTSPKVRRHLRWRSLDAVPENCKGLLQRIPGMTAEPKDAAAVARVFGQKLNRFFVYEEYGAKYETMMNDLISTYKTAPQWELYQRGLEALASSLASIQNQEDHPNKALTVGDLLVKPLQRVCKYPLLFAELLKQTPVCDCPDSHLEIENVLARLRQTTTDINKATDDPYMRIIVERSWILQDRLSIAENRDSHSLIRNLGHIQLCGVLHIAWQTRDGVDGQYMICLLYRDFLLLASASKTEQAYTIQVSISTSELRIENVDNGRGLQCHTAPFSWKIVFEIDHQLFEATMSASSGKEELEWRKSLSAVKAAGENAGFTSLSLDIKPMGTVFGKPGTIARRISIHRATTVGSISGLCQVIIKNTSEIGYSASSINRSQSVLTTKRIPVLAPSRDQRIKLESLLSDVWSREVLPYPGMAVRGSASSIMRKLSVASITSNFSKRSGSLPSLHNLKTTGDEFMTELEVLHGVAYRRDPSRFVSILKENHSQESIDSLPTFPYVGRRVTSLKELLQHSFDGQVIVTPPLRTSSANSMKTELRTPSFSTLGDGEKEKTPKNVKWGKSIGSGKNRAVVTEGLRNFFR